MGFWDFLNPEMSSKTEFRKGSILDTVVSGYSDKYAVENEAIAGESKAKQQAAIIEAKTPKTSSEVVDIAGLYNKVKVQTQGGSGDQSIPDGDNSSISAGASGLFGGAGIDVKTGAGANNTPKGGDTANPAKTVVPTSGLTNMMPTITIIIIGLFAYLIIKEMV